MTRTQWLVLTALGGITAAVSVVLPGWAAIAVLIAAGTAMTGLGCAWSDTTEAGR